MGAGESGLLIFVFGKESLPFGQESLPFKYKYICRKCKSIINGRQFFEAIFSPFRREEGRYYTRIYCTHTHNQVQFAYINNNLEVSLQSQAMCSRHMEYGFNGFATI